MTYGVRYGYNFTDTWGIELSLGRMTNTVTNVVGGDIDLDLTTLDVDAVWHSTPDRSSFPISWPALATPAPISIRRSSAS